MVTDKEALIKRLEEATQGSRELDFWIWWYGASTESRKPNPQPPPDDYVRDHIGTAPKYSTSVDCALSLSCRAGGGGK